MKGPRARSIALLVGLSLSPSAADAQTACRDAEVSAEIDRALADRRGGRLLPAFDRLNALLRRCPSPRVRAQLALAEQSLQRWRDAYAHLTEALAATQDPWISARRPALEEALRELRERLPRLSPQTNVPGAELFVDGVSAGALPLATPRALPGGSATIELRAAGHRTLRRAVSLADGEVFRELLSLEPDAQPPPIIAPPHPPREASVTGGGAQRVIGWSAVGVGAVLGGLGVWQAIEWTAQGSESTAATAASAGDLGAWARFEDEANPDGRLSSQELCDRSRASASPNAAGVRSLCDSNAQHAALALGLGLGGAVVAVAGVVLLVTAPRGRAEHRALRVGPWLQANVVGATAGTEF